MRAKFVAMRAALLAARLSQCEDVPEVGIAW
jgi:hypothetical protein